MADIDKADPRRSATYRAALAAVIILSLLLVLALIAVVAGFVRQARIYQAGRAAPPAIAATAAAAVHLQLAPGARIVSSETQSGKLVLHVPTPAGSEVDVLDLATGALTSQIKDGAK